MSYLGPEHWKQARQLFHEALAVEGEERDAFLAAAEESPESPASPVLREVRALLERHDVPLPLIAVIGETPEGLAGEAPEGEPPLPSRIGPYEVRQVVGQGGMGTVYRAVRADGAYDSEVAIKLLHPGLARFDLERRFRRERQILADLDHPSIARLLDGGVTAEGRHYLVMEYVEGVPLDHYCEQQGLTVEQRLDLFRKACAAVHFAHQNLVVHRDLKPANILVTPNGELKLLDFGIAKLVRPGAGGGLETGTLMAPMTPAFASPEQVQGGPITTATDVYALGNLLYLLLTGRRPFQEAETSPHALVHALCYEKSVPPSRAVREASRDSRSAALARSLEGDLDDIVATALRKEPTERYGSARELSQDIERHLTGQTVLAREPTWWYRLSKFVGRHRWEVAAASLAVLAFVIFTVGLLVQRERILEERSRGEEVTRFLEGLFETSQPDRARGERVTVRELLDRGALDIQGRLGDQPRLQARLLATMGRVYMRLGLLEEARPLIAEAMALRRDLDEVEPGERVESLQDLGDLERFEGRYELALEHYGAALALLEAEGARNSEGGVKALSASSRAWQLLGDFERAEELRQESLRVARIALPADHLLLASGSAELAGLRREQGDLAAAEAAYREALETYRGRYERLHPSVASVLNGLGLLHHEAGRLEEAREALTEALAIQDQVFNEAHPDSAAVRHNLAAVLHELGDLEAAEELARAALEERRRVFGDEHPNLADTLNLLAMVQRQQGRLEDAEASARGALDMWQRLLGPDYVKLGAARNTLGQVLQARGELEAAEPQFREALRVYRAAFGDDHLQVATVGSNLALVQRQRGDLDAARQGYARSLEILRRQFGPGHPRLATVSHNLAVLLEKLGEPEAAEASYREALQAFSQTLPADHPNLAVVRRNLGKALLAQGKAEEARRVLEEALAIFEKQGIEAPVVEWTRTLHAQAVAAGG